ncbi:MAG TPA: dihydroorotase [Rhizomicrobium sp.]|nr:dihydroorotase [Rhizomicrobium sp.]
MTTRTAFLNARLIDPATKRDEPGALLVEDGIIADWGAQLFKDGAPGDARIIDCDGKVLAPGLIDCRVFTGEPGSEHRETLASASQAAAAGGVTTIVVMPNTDPVIDEPSLVDFIMRRAAATAIVRVVPMAALTRHLAGEVMTEIGLLMEAGAVAFTDGDRTIANAQMMRRALAYAGTFGALVVGHAEDPTLSAGAAMNEGEFSMRLGLPAAPSEAETIIVERDIRLVEMTGARYHIGQISCRASLEAVVAAKARGLPITCGVAAHHLALNELDVGAYYTFRKVKPPLRSEADRAAMVEGVASGEIDVIVSSHDPQAADTKRQTFAQSAFGAVGLETLLPAALGVYHDGRASLAHVLNTVTAAPAKLLKLDGGSLKIGAPADLVLFDPGEPFVVDPNALHSRARNTPFEGRKFQGRAAMTFAGGECVFDRAGE